MQCPKKYLRFVGLLSIAVFFLLVFELLEHLKQTILLWTPDKKIEPIVEEFISTSNILTSKFIINQEKLIDRKHATTATPTTKTTTTTPTTTPTTTTHPPIKSNVCLQNHRLQLIDEMCMKHYRTKASHNWVDNLSDSQLRQLANRFVVADEFRVMACLNWKTGSSTWQWILYNNTAPQPLPPAAEANWTKSKNEAEAVHRMLPLHAFKADEIRLRFKTYFKFMSIRHPLDRLVSNHADKLGKHEWYRKQLAPKILQKYRHNVSVHDLKEGLGVTFQEFIRYISDGGKDLWPTAHWHDQISRCQPCKVDYDYIVRTETQEQDAAYIVQHKLIGRGQHAKDKSTRPGVSNILPNFGRYLAEYKDIDDSLLRRITQRYRRDFEMYGYSYTKVNNTVLTSCAIKSNDDVCC